MSSRIAVIVAASSALSYYLGTRFGYEQKPFLFISIAKTASDVSPVMVESRPPVDMFPSPQIEKRESISPTQAVKATLQDGPGGAWVVQSRASEIMKHGYPGWAPLIRK